MIKNVDNEQLDELIAVGNAMIDEGRGDEAITYFRELATRYPEEPRAQFAYASALDAAGHEAEAVPAYEQAMALGLSGSYLARAYLQLGSSLRNIGRYDEAVRLLTEGCAQFPDHEPLHVWLAFALTDAGQPQTAVVELLRLVVERMDSPEMRYYIPAMRRYTDELEQRQRG